MGTMQVAGTLAFIAITGLSLVAIVDIWTSTTRCKDVQAAQIRRNT
jgi:hypothetical protein